MSKHDIEKKTRRRFAFPRSENFKDSLWGREWKIYARRQEYI